MKNIFLNIFFLAGSFSLFGQHGVHFISKELTSGTNTNIRGLSVVDDNIIWASGSNGWVGKSLDAGKTWTWKQVKGFEKLDFRDVEAFDSNNAIIANAGSPAYIMKTNDGGNNWTTVYVNKDSLAFIDGVDFWDDKRGIAYGDPLKGRFMILTTNDGGANWKPIPSQQSPEAFKGEASFAASGTGIRTLEGGYVWMGTGGSHSRLLFSADYGLHWKTVECPILQGSASQGIFSLLFTDQKNGIVVGGDYKMDTVIHKNCFITNDGGLTWKAPDIGPFGYRSCVEALDKKIFVATGTSGTDISVDGGKSWLIMNKDSYNVVKKAKNGRIIYIAGDKGEVINVIIYEQKS